MFKKIAVATFIAALFIGGSFRYVQASQDISLAQFIEILIGIGVIPQDKIAAARAVVASANGQMPGAVSMTAESGATGLVLSANQANFPAADVVAAAGPNNNQYDKLPLLAFNVAAQDANTEITSLVATISASGAAVPTAAYLYDGSTLLGSASVTTAGVATFSNVNYWVMKDSTRILTLKADIRAAVAAPTLISASVSSSGITATDSSSASVTVSGTVVGNTMSVRNSGLVITPVAISITKSQTAIFNNHSTTTVDAAFTIGLQAVGGDVYFGTQSAAQTFTFGIYKDGVRIGTSDVANVVSWSVPAYGAVTNGLPAGTAFKLAQNNSVTIPVDFVFEGRSATGYALPSGNYSVGLEAVRYGSVAGSYPNINTSMSGNASWRSATVSLTSDGNTSYSTCSTGYVMDPSGACNPSTPNMVLKMLSPNGGETLTAGQTYRIKWYGGNSKVDVELLDDQTRLGKKIFSGIPNNGYVDWTVAPLTSADLYDGKTGVYRNPSGRYVMYVTCSDLNCTVDDSDSSFSIAPAAATPVYPTTQACAGSLPTTPGVVSGNGYYTTGYGTNQWTFVTSAPNACQWTCASGYGLSGNGCAVLGTAAPTWPTTQSCGGVQPSANGYTQVGNGYYTTGYGTTQWTFVTSAPNACQYTCTNSGVYTGNGCTAPAPTPAPAPAPAPAAAAISAPSLSTYSWYADDPSTWPTVSTPSSLNSSQAMRVKAFDGSQYYDKTFGVNSAVITASPAAGTSQLILYVYDYGQNNYATDQKVVNVTITNKPVAQTSAPAQTSGPTTSFTISSNSITLGQSITLTSVTNSPSATLQSAAIDQSSDNANWASGAPCGYWSNPGGSLGTHTITCSYTPSTSGTYYFRSRGADANGLSNFVNQTLTVSAGSQASASPASSNLGAAMVSFDTALRAIRELAR